MEPLPQFQLPLTQPPPGFGWETRNALSTKTAFKTGIDQRDVFLGLPRCIICGEMTDSLRHCHIIPQAEPKIWSDLIRRGWIPLQVKPDVELEPRNGLLLCSNHHVLFDDYKFFIRFLPDRQVFIFVNYLRDPGLQRFHGKAIALDIRDHHAPFPSLFIIHEMRVRGFRPFAPLAPAIPEQVVWQDWILSDGVFDNISGSFIRDRPTAQLAPQLLPSATTNTLGGASSIRRIAEFFRSL